MATTTDINLLLLIISLDWPCCDFSRTLYLNVPQI